MSLCLSDGLALPDNTITKTLAILAKRRVGKTYTGSVLAEEMVAAGLPFYVLDPTGASWGLRARQALDALDAYCAASANRIEREARQEVAG